MIVAVGVDIVELERIRALFASDQRERFLGRTFTPEELAYCLGKPDPVPSLAARFAAKEAFQKCWPVSHGWQDVGVGMDGVKPVLRCFGVVAAEMVARGWRAHVSLSHERLFAVAFVTLEETLAGTG